MAGRGDDFRLGNLITFIAGVGFHTICGTGGLCCHRRAHICMGARIFPNTVCVVIGTIVFAGFRIGVVSILQLGRCNRDLDIGISFLQKLISIGLCACFRNNLTGTGTVHIGAACSGIHITL